MNIVEGFLMRKLKYLKKKYRYNPKSAFFFLFLFLFLGSFTMGYAFLTKELSIEGSSTLIGAAWDIHFENIQVKSGSMTPTTAATITNPTTVEFGIDFENPGDFYEFTVDVVNDGTFDAMIESVNILPALTSSQMEYFEYVVTYINHVVPVPYHKLDAGTQETLLVRFCYKDVDPLLYSSLAQEFEISVEINYIQADENAIDVPCHTIICEPGTYLPADSCACVPCAQGSSCPGGEYTFNPTDVNGRTDCPAGTFSLSVSGDCNLCPIGTYQDEIGKTFCKVCANGKTSTEGATSECTTNCSNYANASTWDTPEWTGTGVINTCKIATCASGYELSNDNVCRPIYTVTFNYNKASWNSNTTRTCVSQSNGKCSVTAPGIGNITGTNKTGSNFSSFFSVKGWNTNSSATSATYGATASIEVSGNTTYYAIVTLAKSNWTFNGYDISARTGAGSSYGATGYFRGNLDSPAGVVTVSNFQYTGGSNTNMLWFYATAYTGTCRAANGQTVCTNRWFSAYYVD